MRNRLAQYVGIFALIDLLFLPYYQLIIIPYSLLFIFPIFLWIGTIKNDYYLKLYIIILTFTGLSLAYSFIHPESIEWASDNTKRFLQLNTSFLYFFYFRWIFSDENKSFNIFPILIFFIVFYFILSILFILEPIQVLDFTRFVYGRLVTDEEVVIEHLRYAYLFSDPNTAIYFLLLATAPIFYKIKGIYISLLFWAVLFFIGIVSQSRGGLFCIIFALFFIIYKNLPNSKNLLLILIFSIFIISSLNFFSGLDIFSNIVIESAYNRIFVTEDVGSYGTVGGRTEIWKNAVSNNYILPIGKGYKFGPEGFGPHSDFLHCLYSYGFIATFAMILFLFKSFNRNLILFIVSFIAFAINSLLDDQKVISLYLALLAILVTTTDLKPAT